jgi:hypothetical protein
VGDELAGDSQMTKFFYGTTIEGAILIAKQGKILSPVMQEKSWLNDVKKSQPDYYAELVNGKTIEEVAANLAKTNIASGQEQYINQVTLVDSIQLALLQMARSKKPKIVLAFELNRPKTRIERVPSQLYIHDLTDILLTDEAVPRAAEIVKAYKAYNIEDSHFRRIIK